MSAHKTASPIRIGIVGVGMAGRFHYETLKRIYDFPVEVVGVTSQTAASRESFANERGIRAFDSIDALIAEVDVIDNCAPPYVHESITIQAAEAGKHIIVEKPFTGSFLNQAAYDAQTKKNGSFNEQRYREAVASAERMVAAARQHNVILNFAENWHFLPSGLKAARLMMSAAHKKTRTPDGGWAQSSDIDPGARVLYIRAEESHGGSGSPVYGDLQYAGGGSIVGKVCHPLGFALYLKRLEGIIMQNAPIVPVSVAGEIAWLTKNSYRDPVYENPFRIRSDYVDGEDWAAVDVIFSDGTRARLEANDIHLGGVANWFEVFGSKFFLRGNIGPNNQLLAYSPSIDVFEPEYIREKLEYSEGWSHPAIDEDLAHGYVEQMQTFCDRIKNPDKQWAPPYLDPSHDGDLGIDSVKVMYGAYVSAERGGAHVRIDQPV